MLTQAQLKSVLNYDPATGIFVRVADSYRWKRGAVAGYTNYKGYVRIKIGLTGHFAHRLAWLYVYGDFPENKIDHINGVKGDNRICNLRAATDSENMQNIRKCTRVNELGILGVSKYRKRFKAQIRVNGRVTYLGLFDTPEAAHQAYIAAKRKMHPFSTM